MIVGGYDYAKHSWRFHQHAVRYAARAKRDGLICQECGGSGGYVEPILDDGSGPFETCGYCLGGGFVTCWVRGQWLKDRREIRRKEPRDADAKS